MPPSAPPIKPLARELGVWQATSLNVANMIGIGPFITIPAFIAAMNGPHAMIGWVIAGILVTCDGLVWSELGAALPGSGGSYHFLREIFGRYPLGRLMPFLFIWQFLIAGTLELASGYIGTVNYASYAIDGLGPQLDALAEGSRGAVDAVFPGAGGWLAERDFPSPMGFLAAPLALLVGLLLCRPVKFLGQLSLVLCVGTLATVAVVIGSGLMNFDTSLLTVPEGAWTLDDSFFIGLGAAMRIAVYDYLGYYNICHLGDEVREPGRTIPRAVMWSIAIVASIYLVMNVSIIAVIPWEETKESKNIAALFMERLYGAEFAKLFSWMIVWTAMACVFVATLGYSRIPYAAARSGDFFRPFAYLHPRHGYPAVSLAVLSVLTAVFCFFSLDAVIQSAVTVRIVIQFIGQIAGLHLLRTRRPDVAMPFRMWLYPLPSLVALVGWCFLLWTADAEYQQAAVGVIAAGIVAYALWEIVRTRRGI